jgi:uncharacterized damage-inducible protein DinB
MPHNLVQHLSYNLWANERIGHLLMAHDDAVLHAEKKSSFSSITKTVLHIWDAETIWLTRLKGGSLKDWPSKSFSGNKAELLKGLVNRSTELLQFIKEKGDAYQQEIIGYKNMKGDAYENTVEEILFHLVNHGTYHRGQIITLLRDSDVTHLVGTDLIAWFREQRSKA